MNRLSLFLALILASLYTHAQIIDFVEADPQPELAEIYSGSSDSGDIDGDGDNDLIMSGITPARVTALYLNDGNGNFTEVEDTPFPNASVSVTIFEDLDGDGDLDLFFSGNGFNIQEFAHVYLNDGQGGFTQLMNPSLPQFADSGVDIADVDGDGDADLLIAIKDANGEYLTDVFLNDGDAIFSPSGNTVFPSVQFAAVKFIDADNDGDADIIIAGSQEDESAITSLYLNDGMGNYSADNNLDFVQLSADDVDVADTDNDGDLDILMSGSTDLFEVRTILYVNNGNGEFTEQEMTGLQDTFGGANAMADLDNDGDQDIVIIGSQDGGLPNIYNIVYENLGNNLFNPVDTIGGEYIAACVVDDFNNDELADIIIQGFVNNTTVYWNASVVTSIDELAENISVNVYPNPSSGELNISLENDLDELDLYIYTSEGRLVYEQANVSGIKSQFQLDLQAGTYVIYLKSINSIMTNKLVITK